ncbi:MAG: SusC/RagA family TonB-linked outer membrane protein [Kofleriaceae bacterium]
MALCWLILVLVSTTAYAQKAKTRDVTGVVLDVDAKPIASATVTVTGAGGATATTAPDGTFKLAAPITDALIEITADGFTAKQVPLLAATTAVQLQLTLVKPVPPTTTRVVTGVVTGGAHEPLANARVRVQGTAIETVTAADGTFVLPGVALTDVTLEVEAPNQPATTVAVTGDRAVVAIAVGALEVVQAPVVPTSRTVKGRVLDPSNQEPVAGAQVEVKETGQIAFTEADGSFVLESLPMKPVQLEVTAVEHETRLLQVDVAQTSVDISLGLAKGEQIVIEGRAPVIVKQNLANGASTIDSANLNRVSADTLDTAMTGKLAGANLQFNSGAPGGGAQLRLRGISTINGQSSPLYVVDGVIISNVSVPTGANAITAAAAGGSTAFQDNPTNRISDLNPNDIESVEVLKGASAAALYGSKASNGVIIITTKRGRDGENKMELTQRFGFSQVSNTLGSRTFANVDEVKTAFCADPTTPECTASPLVQAYMQANGKTYDHEAEVTHTPFLRETLGSVSGGTDKGNYYASMLLRDEPGVLIGTFYEKQSGRIAVGYKFGDKLHLGFTANLIHSLSDRGLTNNDNTGTSTYVVLSGTPNFVNLRPTNGIYPINPAIGSGANPLQTVNLLQNREEVWRLISGVNGSYDLWKSGDQQHEIKLLGNFGVDSFTQRNALFAPNALNFEQSNTGLVGTSIDGATSNLNFNIGSGALWTFKPSSGKWHNALSGGVTYETVNLNSTSIVGQNLTAGQPNVNSGTAIQVAQTRLQTKDSGVYAQEEVAVLDDRLSFLGGLLGERSSLNGDTGRYFYYPKLAAVYSLVPVNDDKDKSAFDTWRVRAAYGEAGNRPNYGQKFTPLTATTNIDGNAGVVINGIAGDPNIEPERQREFEAGTDLATKDQRIAGELTVYQRDISNLLLQRALPTSTGFTTQFFNGGALRNRGVEIALQIQPIASKKITWTTRGTLTLNRSEVTELTVPTFDITTVGFGVGLGAFRIEQGKSATQIVAQIDKQGTVAVVGDGEPDFRIGWTNTINVGDFTIGALIDWQHGSDVVNLTRLLYDFGNNSADTAAAADRLKAFGNKDFRPYIEDASFVKLREISIAYNLPKHLVAQIGGPLKTLQVSAAGRNLVTLTGYSGLDPEVSNFGNQPIGRNYDVAPYPPSRSFWFSITAGL